MKVSVNWLKEYTEIDLSIDELVAKIGVQLGAVEEVIDLGKKYQGIVIAKVVSCHKHPNADKLKVCQIETGKAEIQVVCGAPNVRAGMLVAWLPPGSTVPATFDKDPFVLEARELRGQMSTGMLASPSELGISDDHSGILEIPADKATPGDDFARTFGLDDYIIDIENKMFTHRPDLFGMLGVAREIAGIQHKPFKSPAWYTPDPKFPDIETEELKLEVRNEIPELVPRFVAVAMRDVQTGPSPLWLHIALAKLGQKSINNIVDYTNYFMLLTGQPIHAYDYDKVKALSAADHAVLVIRHPKPGEKIKLLNGKTIEPRPAAMMAATDTRLIGLGGAMGGTDTEIDDNTQNIIIEAATWDMFNMRRTSMEHGIFTDAVTRFTKGQSPRQNLAVVARIVDEIRAQANGKIASSPHDAHKEFRKPLVQRIKPSFINERLGLDLSISEMQHLLTDVEFAVSADDNLAVGSPFWRTDIEIPEDIVEEVGRLYGYDHLPLDLPRRSLVPVGPDKLLRLKDNLRSRLARLGANEVLTYSFVHGNLLDKVGQDKAQAFKLSNALSPDLQYYRLSLTPSLLDKVHMNIKAGYDQFALFEIGKTHIKGFDNEEDLPTEFERIALVFAADSKSAYGTNGAPYFAAKQYLTDLLAAFGLHDNVTFELLDPGDSDAAAAYYEVGRAATILLDGKTLGRIGEYKPMVRKALKLPDCTAGFELGLEQLLNVHSPSSSYHLMSKFPSISQDICLQVADSTSYGELTGALDKTLHAAVSEHETLAWEPIDIYASAELQAQKRITYRVTLTSQVQTLTDAALGRLLDTAAAGLEKSHGARRI